MMLAAALAFMVLAFPQRAGVELGAAGAFAVLTKTGITTTGATSIIGDIGVSPAAGSYFTGFAHTPNSAAAPYSTSTVVTGKIFAANYMVPTPANMAAAVADMGVAYRDAAARGSPDTLNLGGGVIEGMTLPGGLHKFGGAVSFTTTVTYDAEDDPDTVFILQIAGALNLATGAQVELINGAVASNIFWQIAGQTMEEFALRRNLNACWSRCIVVPDTGP